MNADKSVREAERHLYDLAREIDSDNTPENRMLSVLSSQALATLALAEQQRISNLVAILALGGGDQEDIDLSQEFYALKDFASSVLLKSQLIEDDLVSTVNTDIANSLTNAERVDTQTSGNG